MTIKTMDCDITTEDRSEKYIQKKIDSRRARTYTASEFKRFVRSGSRLKIDNVDVVTCGTLGVMSGTMAIFSIPIGKPGDFIRADAIYLNGVPGTIGPCPNESLGIVDCIVHGTSARDPLYGGGHLFRDMVSGASIDAVVLSGYKIIRRKILLSEIPFAKMVLTRGAFKNYMCFVNSSNESYRTIFSGPNPLGGKFSEASVSGCGEINPLQNDPYADYLRPGASVMLNGAVGMVIGPGTRSTSENPNLSVVADMHKMKAEYMGGFITSNGPECLTSLAAALPVTSSKTLDNLSVLDEDIPLPIVDVHDRVPIGCTNYSNIWNKNSMYIFRDPSKCLHCDVCMADSRCPTNVHPSKGVDNMFCIMCGLCTTTCIGGVFSSMIGNIRILNKIIPITIRQSSRPKAEMICQELKIKVKEGKWKLRCCDGEL